MNTWKKGNLGDFITLQRGFDLPEYERHSGDIPVVTSSGSSDFHNESKVKAPGVVMGRYGTIGAIYFIEKDYWPHNTTLYVKDFKGNHQRFIYYFLKTLNYQAHNDKSSVPGVNRNHLHLIPVNIPPLPEQRAIAGILGALDDKIELNHRMNRALESLARAVFRQWFVEGEENDWEEKSLDEIADYLNGLALQKYPAKEGEEYLPVIKIAQLRTSNTESADRASVDIPPQYIIEDGDILFSWSGSLTVVVWCGGKGALNQHLFKVTSKKYPKWFYYYWTKHHLADFQAIAAGKATTMGHIQRHHLSAAKVLVPSDKELQEMDNIMSPILDKIINNEKESRTLASLRDSLLPKLMRGEVRLK